MITVNGDVAIENVGDGFDISIDTDSGEMTVWNDGSGSRYDVAELAPYTDD